MGGIQLGQNSFYQMSQINLIKYLSMRSVETIFNLIGEKNTDNRKLLFLLKKYKQFKSVSLRLAVKLRQIV